jgi:hypothetical protein
MAHSPKTLPKLSRGGSVCSLFHCSGVNDLSPQKMLTTLELGLEAAGDCEQPHAKMSSAVAAAVSSNMETPMTGSEGRWIVIARSFCIENLVMC